MHTCAHWNSTISQTVNYKHLLPVTLTEVYIPAKAEVQ